MGAVIHFPRVKLSDELEAPTVETRGMEHADDGRARRDPPRGRAAEPARGGGAQPWRLVRYCDHPSCVVRAAPWREEEPEDGDA